MGVQNNSSQTIDPGPRKWWIKILQVILVFLGVILVPTTIRGIALSPAQGVQDLAISKQHQGDFTIGSSGVYTIEVSNQGSGLATGAITVTDILTNSLAPVGVNTQGWDPCGFSGQALTCIYSNTAGITTGAVLPSIRLSVNVGATSSPTLVNSATLANTNEITTTNNIANDPTNIIGADLAVSKTLSPASPAEGSTITYTISIVNAGPSQAASIQLTDVLPTDVTYQSSTATQGTYTPLNGIWSAGTLAKDASASLQIRAAVNGNTKGKTIVNTVTGVTSDVVDYNPNNNTASVSFTVPSSTQVRGLVTDNVTDKALAGVSVELRDSASHIYTYNTAANGWYTFTNTITTPISAGAATIRATKTGYATKTANPVLTQGQSTRQDFALDTADLLVTKSDGATTVVPGATFTYTIVISNVGTLPAASVVFTDVLPSQISYLSDTSGITHTVPVAHTYVWKLTTTVNPNSAFRFRLRVRVADALPSPTTALTNVARVSTTSPEANLANNAAQDTNASAGTPNPTITLSVSPNQVRTGQNATYLIKLTNTGTGTIAPITAITVEDTFSTLLDISSAKTTKGTATVNSSTRKVTVTIDVLKPKEEVTITVVAKVNNTATANTTVTNSATMRYTFGGSNFSRQSNSVSFQLIVSSTLPGTGGAEASDPEAWQRIELSAFLAAALLGILGLIGIGYAIWVKKSQSDWSGWALKMGLLLGTAAVLFGLVGLGLRGYSFKLVGKSAVLQQLNSNAISKADEQPSHTPELMIWPDRLPNIPGSELDKLPDFPVPTPTIAAAGEGAEKSADITPVSRILIPALALDTVVKYVPFDGLTWLIAGLQNEIAWMGDTSWPGLGSNTALAGHVTLRTGVDGPFRFISDLRYGDSVFVYTDENIYHYMVQDQRVVDATDLTILEPTEDSTLTLITCTEWDAFTGFYTRRLAVTADLIDVKPAKQEAMGN